MLGVICSIRIISIFWVKLNEEERTDRKEIYKKTSVNDLLHLKWFVFIRTLIKTVGNA